ncbi:MAG: diguanylate cyclase [Candidatus Paceibacterota bacterium]|jgi:diguanylate cyclase (GGDEF)-like protein|nr:diguanylate cyclase [Candidatus Paceibacterota bacterium]
MKSLGTELSSSEKEEIERLSEENAALRKKLAERDLEIYRLQCAEKGLDPMTKLPLMIGFENKCISAMKKFEDTKKVAPLTPIYNKVKHARGGTKHCIGYVDLDGVAWANKAYGHEVGDKIIEEAANILNRRRRPEDLIVRRQMGGDEFLFLFLGTENEEAGTKPLLDARTHFEELIARRFPYLVGKVSFSFAVKMVNSGMTEDQVREAINEADANTFVWKDRRKMSRVATNLQGEE